MANCFVTWLDDRPGGNNDQQYYQMLNGDADTFLAADGATLGALTVASTFNYGSACTDWFGGYYSVWIANNGSGYDLRAQRTNATGAKQWGSSGVLVDTLTALPNDVTPKVSGDPSGGCFIAWQKNGAPRQAMLIRLTSAGAVDSGWTAGGTDLSPGGDSGGYLAPPIVPGNGFVYVGWLDPDTANTTFPQVRVQKFATGSSTALWTAGGVNLGASPTFMPQGAAICYDGAGGLYVACATVFSTGFLRVRHVSSAGVNDWTSSNLSVASAGFSGICRTGNAAIVFWQEPPLTFSQYSVLKAARITVAGVVSWSVSLFTSATGMQSNIAPIAVSDGLGGAIVMVNETLSTGAFSRVLVQRVDSAGLTPWGPSMIAVLGPSASQGNGWMCSDGASGCVVVMQDRVSGSSTDSIYANRVDANGGFPWGTTGAPVCTAANQQKSPYVALDNAGFGDSPTLPPTVLPSNAASSIEENIRYLIDDKDKSHYSISSVRLRSMIVAHMSLIANRTLMEMEAVTTLTMLSGTYDYSLVGLVGAVRQCVIDRWGLELKRVPFDEMASWYQDASATQPRGTPRYFSVREESNQVTKLRVWPTPDTLSSGPLDLYYSIIPTTLPSDSSAIPFSSPLLRALERSVAIEAALSMSDQDRLARMIDEKVIRAWQQLVEEGIKAENWRLRVANSGTQDRILEMADQWPR